MAESSVVNSQDVVGRGFREDVVGGWTEALRYMARILKGVLVVEG